MDNLNSNISVVDENNKFESPMKLLDRLFDTKIAEVSAGIENIEKVIIEQSNEKLLKEEHERVNAELKTENEKDNCDVDKVEALERKEKNLRMRIIGRGVDKPTRKLLENKYQMLEHWKRIRNNNTEETAPSNILYWVNRYPENFPPAQRKAAAYDARYMAGATTKHIEDYIEHHRGKSLTRKAHKALITTLKPFLEGGRLKADFNTIETVLSRVVDIVFSQTRFTQHQALEFLESNRDTLETKLTGDKEKLKGIIDMIRGAGNSFLDILIAMRPVLTWKVNELVERDAKEIAKKIFKGNYEYMLDKMGLHGDYIEIEIVKEDSLIYLASGTKIPPSVVSPSRDNKKSTVKVSMVNFKFLTKEDGSLDINFSLIGAFNLGAGGRVNFFHPLISIVKDNYDLIQDNEFKELYKESVASVEILTGKKSKEFAWDKENELLSCLFSLKYTAKWLSEQAKDLMFYDGDIYADEPEAGVFFTFVGEAIDINPKKVEKIIKMVNSLGIDELMARLYRHGKLVYL